jgi:hypothetical protein
VGGAAGIAELETAGRLNNGQVIPYALALSIGDVAGMRTLQHSGSYGGYRSSLVRFPEKQLSVMTLCNTSAASPTLAEQVGTLMLGVLPARTTATTLDLSTVPYNVGGTPASVDTVSTRRRNDQLAQLAGSYYSDELDLPVTLVARDGVLLLQRPHAADIRFITLASDLFTSSDKILLQVVRDDHNSVNGFTLTISRARGLEFVRRDADHGASHGQ